MNNKLLIFTFSTCLISSYLFAQNDTLEYIYSYTYKNISSYNIVNESKKYVNRNLTYLPFYTHFLPDKGFSLDMQIEKLQITYPLENYTLYSILLQGFVFTNEKLGTTKRVISNVPTGVYLIALDYKNKSIKYITGNFFWTPIAEDFKFDASNSSSYLTFLKLKLFYLHPSELVFKTKSKKKIVFETYSQTLNKNIKVEVFFKSIEIPIIKF